VKIFQTPGRLAVISGLSMMACGHARPEPAAPPPPPRPTVQLAVLPAESDSFPGAARAVTTQLAVAKVKGADETKVSKVSLEVAQLAVECVEPTAACYEAVGRSMSANRLLFARIDSATKRSLKVTVTLYDVDANAELKTAEKVFATETEAARGAAALVDEVTQ
jgi:hypothetical protein